MKKIKYVIFYSLFSLFISMFSQADIKKFSESKKTEIERVLKHVNSLKSVLIGFILAVVQGIGKGFLSEAGKAIAKKLKDILVLWIKKKAAKKGKGIGKKMAEMLYKLLETQNEKDSETEVLTEKDIVQGNTADVKAKPLTENKHPKKRKNTKKRKYKLE